MKYIDTKELREIKIQKIIQELKEARDKLGSRAPQEMQDPNLNSK